MRNTFTEKTEDEKGDETDKVGCEKKSNTVFVLLMPGIKANG